MPHGICIRTVLFMDRDLNHFYRRNFYFILLFKFFFEVLSTPPPPISSFTTKEFWQRYRRYIQRMEFIRKYLPLLLIILFYFLLHTIIQHRYYHCRKSIYKNYPVSYINICLCKKLGRYLRIFSLRFV